MRKEKNKKEKECPLCEVSQETLKRLKEEDKKKPPRESKKKNLLKKLFKK